MTPKNTELNKKQQWKLARGYFFWKAKDVKHNHIFFLDFDLWAGELIQTCVLFCKYKRAALKWKASQ